MKDKKPIKRSWLKMGLRGQQVVLFLLVSLTPLLVVSITIKILGTNALKSSVGENLISLAQQKLIRIDRAISDRIRQVRREISDLNNIRIAMVNTNNAKDNHDVYFKEWSNLANSLRLLENYTGSGFRRRGNTGEVTIANRQGFVIRSNQPEINFDPRKPLPHKVDDQVWWIKAKNNDLGHDYVEDITYDSEQNNYRLPVALPIRSRNLESSNRRDSKVIGIVKIVLMIREISNIVESQPEMGQTHTILTNQSGIIIAASEESGYKYNEKMRIEHAAARAIIEAKLGNDGLYYGYEAVGETDTNNESRVYGWARTQLSRWQPWKKHQNFSNWIVFVSYPSSHAYAGVTKLNQYVLWVTIASCVIVAPIVYTAAQRITNPIMQLAETAKSIGQEAKNVIQVESDQIRQKIADMQWFQSEAPELTSIESKNEVGMLAQEFNDMHYSLKVAIEKLVSAEEQMTTIVDCLGEGLVVVDTQDKILYFNPAAKHLLNFNESSQFPDRFTDLLRTTNLAVLENTYGKDTRATVEINLEKEGENRILRVVTSQYYSIATTTTGSADQPEEKLELAGMIYVFDDITREHEIDKMKSDFVALVSHELRTPLTSIIGFISLILDGKAGPLNKVQEQSLTRAHRQSKRLATMINDLLDISRIEAGRIVIKLEPVNIAEIAQHRIEELKPQADEKTIKLDLTFEPDLPELTGDEERLGQIFTNLIGNAIKFTPTNGMVKVKISKTKCPYNDETKHYINDKDGIHVEVVDNGPGIPAQERENVFDKFQQLSNVQTREQGGTGLGLSIAQGFVEAHKGKIWVSDGENNIGCNFQFWIPFLS